MKPKFALQSILDYRHSRVEALEIELGQILAARQECLSRLEALETLRLAVLEELGSLQSGEIDFLLVGQARQSLRRVETALQDQRRRLGQLDRQAVEKRQEVVAARQGEETLVILKDKEAERFAREQSQREIRQQDDVYIAQAFRNAPGLKP